MQQFVLLVFSVSKTGGGGSSGLEIWFWRKVGLIIEWCIVSCVCFLKQYKKRWPRNHIWKQTTAVWDNRGLPGTYSVYCKNNVYLKVQYDALNVNIAAKIYIMWRRSGAPGILNREWCHIASVCVVIGASPFVFVLVAGGWTHVHVAHSASHSVCPAHVHFKHGGRVLKRSFFLETTEMFKCRHGPPGDQHKNKRRKSESACRPSFSAKPHCSYINVQKPFFKCHFIQKE